MTEIKLKLISTLIKERVAHGKDLYKFPIEHLLKLIELEDVPEEMIKHVITGDAHCCREEKPVQLNEGYWCYQRFLLPTRTVKHYLEIGRDIDGSCLFLRLLGGGSEPFDWTQTLLDKIQRSIQNSRAALNQPPPPPPDYLD